MKGIDQIATKKYSGFFAWPTVVMAYALGLGFVACLVLTYLGLFPLWLCSIINFILCYLAFTPLHEAVHNNVRGVFRKWQWVENSVGHITATMLLGPFPCFSFLHLAHHAHTNVAHEDPDTWVAGKTPWAVFWRCMSIVPHYYHYFFKSKKRVARRLFWPTMLAMGLMIAVLLVASFMTSFSLMFFGWVIPAIFANAALAFVLDYVPHVPHDSVLRYKNTNIVFGRIIYLLSMGHSYHVIHHLWPRIPFYRYKQAFAEYRTVIEKEGTPIFSSFSQLLNAAKR